MKPCRNLTCAHFNANILITSQREVLLSILTSQREVLLTKNYKHDPRSNSLSASTYDFHYYQQANKIIIDILQLNTNSSQS